MLISHLEYGDDTKNIEKLKYRRADGKKDNSIERMELGAVVRIGFLFYSDADQRVLTRGLLPLKKKFFEARFPILTHSLQKRH